MEDNGWDEPVTLHRLGYKQDLTLVHTEASHSPRDVPTELVFWTSPSENDHRKCTGRWTDDFTPDKVNWISIVSSESLIDIGVLWSMVKRLGVCG